MNDVINLFYENVIPEMLNGHVDCEILARVICNVYFTETDKLLLANNKYDAEVPTLIINNVNRFNQALELYVKTILDYLPDKYRHGLSMYNQIKYVIALSFVNMGKNDFLNPVNYYNRLIYALKNNPCELGDYDVCELQSAKSNNQIKLNIDYEDISQECPFKCVITATNGENEYQFQTIRFYIVNDKLYLGAIQGRNSSNNRQYESEIRRLAYKLNSGIPQDSALLNADPSAVLGLTIFISFMKQYGINKVSLLPYGIVRLNDKKIMAHDLPNQMVNKQEPYKQRVKEKISQITYYLDNYHSISSKLLLTLQRINYEFDDAYFEEFDNTTLDIHNIKYSNNEIANSIFQEINNEQKKNYHI